MILFRYISIITDKPYITKNEEVFYKSCIKAVNCLAVICCTIVIMHRHKQKAAMLK